MLAVVGEWIKEGKLKYRETRVKGFDKLPEALNSLFHGANTGKLVVQAEDYEDGH